MIYKAILDTPISWRTKEAIKEKYSIGATEYGKVYSLHAITFLFGQETVNKVRFGMGEKVFCMPGKRNGKTVSGVSEYAMNLIVEHHNHKFEKEYDLPDLEELEKTRFDVDKDKIRSPKGARKKSLPMRQH